MLWRVIRNLLVGIPLLLEAGDSLFEVPSTSFLPSLPLALCPKCPCPDGESWERGIFSGEATTVG